jgi:hypothetical protein
MKKGWGGGMIAHQTSFQERITQLKCDGPRTDVLSVLQFTIIGSQGAIFYWKKVHKRSYELVRLYIQWANLNLFQTKK